ncbi:uncharacterized protein LOC143462465 [Clavelina lepadiformis]|uniref:uncharacterized protein LOC143462465 n=1 Tax=Clavelina lepadiformis TaxID=159417 RepID=UPI004041FB91
MQEHLVSAAIDFAGRTKARTILFFIDERELERCSFLKEWFPSSAANIIGLRSFLINTNKQRMKTVLDCGYGIALSPFLVSSLGRCSCDSLRVKQMMVMFLLSRKMHASIQIPLTA